MDEQRRKPRCPAIHVPPLVLAAAAALLMAGAARMVPELQGKLPGRVPLGLLVMLVGSVIALLGLREFRRARTTPDPLRPAAATALVETGVYAWSRNPMYLGIATALVGWALFLAHPLALVVVPGFVLLLNRCQIEREERALSALFGPAFDEYCRRVGRWLSFGPGDRP